MRGTSIAIGILGLCAACGSSQPPAPEPTPAPEPAAAPAPAPAPAPVAEPTPAAAGFDFSGAVTGDVPEGAELAVVWVVFTGDPDRAYNIGTGAITGATYRVTLPGDAPPPEVFNDLSAKGMGRIAIGVLAVMAPGTGLPTGELTDKNAFKHGLLGVSARHAVVWRDGEFAGKLSWPASFPAGAYACGACVDGEGTFDALAVADCGEVELMVGKLGELDFCNLY